MKKILSALILSFLLFGSATVSSNDRMELRGVLDNNIANTDSGKVVRTKRAADTNTKEVADGVKVQQRKNDNGTYEMIDNKERIDVLLKLVNLFDESIEQVLIEYDRTNASRQDIKDGLKEAFKNKIKFKE